MEPFEDAYNNFISQTDQKILLALFLQAPDLKSWPSYQVVSMIKA